MSAYDRFVIPFALVMVDGVEKTIRPYQATKDQTPKCPECLETVVLRRASLGESGSVIRLQHFAHLPRPDGSESTCQGGTGEGHVHLTAKKLVSQSIGEWMLGERPRPFFKFKCSCGQEIRKHLPFLPIMVKIEHVLPCGLKPDVFVQKSTESGAIEVFKSHRIGIEKIEKYITEVSWWVEIEADPILGDPGEWIVHRSSFKPDSFCPACVDSKVQVLRLELSRLSRDAAGIEAKRQEKLREIDALESAMIGLDLRCKDAERRVQIAEEKQRSAELQTQQAQSRAEMYERRANVLKEDVAQKEQHLSNVMQELQITREEILTASDVQRLRVEKDSLSRDVPKKQEEYRLIAQAVRDEQKRKKSVEEEISAIQQKRMAQETEDERFAYYQNCIETAANHGYKPGWASYRYKERYGDWPPQEWRTMVKSGDEDDGVDSF